MTLPAELDPALADLLAPYAAREADAPYDEALGPDGAVRAHWADLLDWTGRAGTAGYAAVTAETRRLRIESGVAFDPSGDEISSAGADAFPVVIEPSEWERLAEGIAQRARLIEAALADIYGPRALLREGLLPPGLIYGNPDFAQWLRTPQAPPGPWLTLYEMDLARGADGRWVAISDRSDAPLGDGWLIANRVASSQSFAEPFLAGRIRRLAAHYEDTQAYLEEAAGPDGRMALLSGGARHGRYFSHAYFARYLGAALIEPADLTVRGGDAFVKTIDGLQPLALLLRGERDRKLDALFAPDHAAPGAPALSLAARSGRLKLANALGASALAYRAIAPYARQAARRLIGEELFLDDAPCLWLGDPAAREQVMDEPEFWRVEHVSRGPLEPDAPSLYAKDRDALARRLAREGDRWAAVATPRLATAPVWKDGALAPRPWIMRVFASRTPEGWSVAPGGVASAVEQGRAPPPLGFGKDVWVPARNDEEAKSAPSLDRRLAGAHLRRTGGDLLSRVADDLFWLGRGAVRAETTLRVLHLAIERMLSARDEDGGPEILAAILEIQATPNEARTGMAGVRDAVARLSADLHEPLGMPMLLNRLRGAGQRARPYLSEESWRSLDRLTSDRGWRRPPPAGAAAALLRLIDDSLMSLAAFAGTTAENLTRNHVWRFLELGRSVERSLVFSRAAERLAGRRGEPDEPWLRAWLTLADSRTAYRTRYLTVPAAAPAIDLLIVDENNPRSLVHQLARIERALDRLPSAGPRRGPEQRIALRALTEVRLAEPERLAEPVETGGERQALAELLSCTNARLAELSDQLGRSYFAHTEAPSRLAASGRREA